MPTVPIRSMTGFGEAVAETDSGRLRVEVRTVNHKHLNVQMRGPNGIERHQVAVEKALRTYFARGHVMVGVVIDRSPDESRADLSPDLDRARGYLESLRAIQEALGLEGAIEIGHLARFRDVFQEEAPDGADELPVQALLDAVATAAASAVGVREEEGRRLAGDLEERLDVMADELARISERAPARLEAERDRLREAIRALLEVNVAPDEDRIAREIAHLAERWDIHEELVRFASHLEMFREALEVGGEGGVGKRLGFIAQEFLREANTIGSKANDAEITRRVVALKEEIDRVREQIENVE